MTESGKAPINATDPDKDSVEEVRTELPKEDETILRGWELKRLRNELGFSATEFARYLKSIGAKITTARSVYRLENRRFIQPRYIAAFTAFVGKRVYKRVLTRLRTEPGPFSSRYARTRRQEKEQNDLVRERYKVWEENTIGR